MSDYEYRGICHTSCYWRDTLWEVGDVYEGEIPPNKHFSVDGKKDPELPPPNAGSDPRSTEQLKKELKKRGFNVADDASRKEIWEKLYLIENDMAKDLLTKKHLIPTKAPCGFVGKSPTGAAAHARTCEKCKEITQGEAIENGDAS